MLAVPNTCLFTCLLSCLFVCCWNFHVRSHPFDPYGDKTDDEVQEAITALLDAEDSVKSLHELVFDNRVEGLSDSCIELMKNLMHPDPEKRVSSDNFLRNPWTQGLTASWKSMVQNKRVQAVWQEKFRSEVFHKYAPTTHPTTTIESLTTSDLRTMFRAMKPTKDGFLGFAEIRKVFGDLGFSDENIRSMFTSIDLDGTGCIHFDEFQALMSETTQGSSSGGGEQQPGLQANYLQRRFKSHIVKSFATVGSRKKGVGAASSFDQKQLRNIFNAIDLEGNGYLDLHEIRVALRSSGKTDDVISRIVASLDLDQNGKVTWEEFVAIMKREER